MHRYTPEAAAYRLLDRRHAGQPYKDIVIDDWTLEGSCAAQEVAEEATWVGVEPLEIVAAARRIIEADAAEYAALR